MANAAKKSLVIVESPAKAKTIGKYLGKDYVVHASMGHVKDLPKKSLGVDPDNGFDPEYVTITGKDKFLTKIKKAAKTAKAVYLAPDPDREGEAIAWHIADEIKDKDIVFRATFNEITKSAVQNAIGNPTRLDKSLYEAQQARRILDRLVGYKISPLLWKKIQRGLSAGRVQSVAVRMIVDREAEIVAFKPEEYWTIDTLVCRSVEEGKDDAHKFKMRLAKINSKKAEVTNAEDATKIREEILAETLAVTKIVEKEVKRNPSAPFITSTLQQEASRKLNFSSKKTMMMAQKLYEGVEIDGEPTGLITYMRTDSTRVAKEAVNDVRALIEEKYGKDFVPAKAVEYKTKKSAQDAHEAIRPTSMRFAPDEVKDILNAIDKDLIRLYTLVWNRFVSSQMSPAIFDQKRVEAKAGKYLLTASGQVQKFAGFLAVYEEGKDDTVSPEDAEPDHEMLPAALAEKDELAIKDEELKANQHFTKPPPRFTEPTLVKELEKQGIGRPSTYASIISVIQDRKYVLRDDRKRFFPSALGKEITKLLKEHFGKILDVKFTALMEEQLDQVETGKVKWEELLDNFWREFKVTLEEATVNMKNLKREVIPTEEKCEKCGTGTMVIRWGRNGRFLACDQYPECKSTKPYIEEGEEGQQQDIKYAKQVCSECGKKMVIKTGRWGRFAACIGYPDCKKIEPIKTMVKCSKDGCDGDLVERTSKRGKVFFSCTNYKETGCDYVSWDKPVPFKCPSCGYYFMLQTKKGGQPGVRCESCSHKCTLDEVRPREEKEAEEAAETAAE